MTHSESFQFIDVFDQHPQAQNRGEGPLNVISLKYIYDLLSAKLSDSQTHGQIPLVILDDITSLEWLGVSLLDLSRFARALRALCVKVRQYQLRAITAFTNPNTDGRSISRQTPHRHSTRARCTLAALASTMHLSHRGQAFSQRAKRCSERRGAFCSVALGAPEVIKPSRYVCT